MGLFRKWGFGAELTFDSTDAVARMGRASRATRSLRADFDRLKTGAAQVRNGLGMLGLAVAPILAGIGALGVKSSGVAAEFETTQKVMTTLLGTAERADDLIGRVKSIAASSSFGQSDLIEGSKRLLRLTGENVDRNVELLNTVRQMTALNPSKSIVDATEAILDATSGGGFERMKEFGFALKAVDFEGAGRAGGKEWASAVLKAVEQETGRLTRGVDLDAEVAQTTTGVRSIFMDSLNNAMIPIGAAINRVLNPAIRMGTNLVNRFTRAFESLSPETQDMIAQAVIFSGSLIGIAGGAGVAFLALGGLVSIASGALTALAGLAGLIFNPATIGFAAAMGATLTLVAGAIATVIALGYGRMMPLWEASRDAVGRFVGGVLPLLQEVGRWIGEQWGMGVARVTVLLRPLRAEFGDLVSAVSDLVGQFGHVYVEGEQVRGLLETLGPIVQEGLGIGLGMAATATSWIVQGLTAVVRVAATAARWVRMITGALLGSASATRELQTSIDILTSHAEAALFRLTGRVVAYLVASFGRVMGLVASGVAQIPGVGPGLADGIRSAAGDLQLGGVSLTQDIAQRADRATSRASALEARRAAASASALRDAPLTADVKVDTKVCVDGQEIARANGSAAVRAGERGSGPALPPEQRVRVLRGGGMITALRPSEAF